QRFNEWNLPAGAHPHGLLVDKEGKVWYTGNGNGTIGELDPATGKVISHKAPSGGSPHTLVIDDAGAIWFTSQSGYVGASTELAARSRNIACRAGRTASPWTS